MRWIEIKTVDDLPKDGEEYLFDADEIPPVWARVYKDRGGVELQLRDSSGEIEFEEWTQYNRWLCPTKSADFPDFADSEDARILNDAKATAFILDWFDKWCEKTKRSGGVLITTSIKELLFCFYNDVLQSQSDE